MSEPSNQPQNGGTPPDDKPDAQQQRFNVLPMSVLTQYVKDLSFENPSAPQSLAPGKPAPKVAIRVDVRTVSTDQGPYEVTLSVHAEAKSDDTVVFLIELAYAGLFSLPNVPAEHHRPILLIEAPRLLFPLVRSIIADVTREGGYPPLMLNPIDFADLYRRQLMQDQQTASAPPPTAELVQ